MSSTLLLVAGRIVITLAAISNSISPYLADFNHTHVYNPNWPPHARFHNGQTMSMGLVLGLATLYYTWRPALSSTPFTKLTTKDSMFTAAVMGSLYWITGLSARLYPGALFFDPEFIGSRHDIKLLGYPVQATVFTLHLALCWTGYALVIRGLRDLKND